MKAWDEISTQALIGTDRQSFAVPQLPVALHASISRITDDTPEGKLLSSAALIQTYTQAGQIVPQHKQNPIAIAPDEERPPCSPQAGRLMVRLFADEEGILKKFSSRLAIEWMDLAEIAGCLAPPACLAALFRRGEHDHDLREKIILQRGRVLGRRAVWLAQLNKDWAYAAGSSHADDSSVWEEGLPEERRDYLARLRASDPAAARNLLAATWKQETGENRKDFLDIFVTGLTMADENFLEVALEDRIKGVRRTAAELLSRLPQSRFGQRMSQRLSQFVRFEKKLLGGKKIVVELPEVVDDSMKRDTIEEKKNAPQNMGVKGYTLNQIVALTPLEHWSAISGLNADELIGLARMTDWSYAIINGWSQAAAAQRNGPWLQALLHNVNKGSAEYDQHDLIPALPAEEAKAFLTDIIECKRNAFDVGLMYLGLQNDEVKLDAALTKALLRQIPGVYIQSLTYATNPTRPDFLGTVALKADPQCLPEANEASRQLLEKMPGWSKDIQGFMEIFEIRHAMHKELSQ